tara:strand:- start:599 stop:1372 length:774 start_codon:yes stop_codon:yes gene_type:complete
MKAVILAGGFGTRLSEETLIRPKPMVEIGDYPILWHIMKIYSHYGINEFIICCGYKGYMIKEYFSNYFLHTSDVTFNLINNEMKILNKRSEEWKITLIDTGLNTKTGGRLKLVKDYIGNDSFCFTYGDGLANIDLNALIYQHKTNNNIATITAVQPPGRFGSLEIIDENLVSKFKEKPPGDSRWINGGFFVLEPSTIDLIENEQTSWEEEPLKELAKQSNLSAYFHKGFWQPMDSLKDKNYLESLWVKQKAPWKVWA